MAKFADIAEADDKQPFVIFKILAMVVQKNYGIFQIFS